MFFETVFIAATKDYSPEYGAVLCNMSEMKNV